MRHPLSLWLVAVGLMGCAGQTADPELSGVGAAQDALYCACSGSCKTPLTRWENCYFEGMCGTVCNPPSAGYACWDLPCTHDGDLTQYLYSPSGVPYDQCHDDWECRPCPAGQLRCGERRDLCYDPNVNPCAGKNCGAGNCGGTCGTCGYNQYCSANGTCECTNVLHCSPPKWWDDTACMCTY